MKSEKKRKKAEAVHVYAVSFLVFAVLMRGVVVYSVTAHIMKQQMGNKCRSLASAVAALLEIYPKEYPNFIHTLDIMSEYYVKTRKLIAEIRFDNMDNIAFLYAENGAEAVKKITAAPDSYDIIFMDVQMPEMDGYEAARVIRAFEKEGGEKDSREIPIVAMTANVFQEDIKKCLDAGMNDHVGKPLNFEEVLEKLRLHLPSRNPQHG